MNIDDEFRKIRDIPYCIPLALSEPDDCCSGKATRLKELLEACDMGVRYRVCRFRWPDLGLPSSLLAVPHEDECTHTYLEVMIQDTWRIVDPTWDAPLAAVLPVNDWDGFSDTVVAVPAYATCSLEESAALMVQYEDADVITADLAKNGAFYAALNDWLATVRRHNL
jgi:hypothetical protein